MKVELKKWNMSIGESQPLFCILGLNVLEDEGLALETASELKKCTSELNLPFVFKASFDKANRSSIHSFRGPGMERGLKILAQVKENLGVPVITDIHEPDQAEAVSQVADIVQIPAFLVRQTNLIVSAAKAVQKTKGLLHVKKAQFMAPWDCQNILKKVEEVTGQSDLTILCERGTSFGYNNLVVDMLGIPEMKKLGVPVTIDATHAVQLPGGQKTTTGGRREGVSVIAASAVAAGADGVFLEFHPDPEKAKCDGPSCLPLEGAKELLTKLKSIYEISR